MTRIFFFFFENVSVLSLLWACRLKGGKKELKIQTEIKEEKNQEAGQDIIYIRNYYTLIMVLIIMSYNVGIISGVKSNQLQEGEKKKLEHSWV